MNKKILAILALFFSFGIAFAQISVDPQDEFYTYAQSWELRGYVKSLPQLRPYPLNLIKEILTQVMEKGTRSDVALAQDYYEKITGKPYHLDLEGGLRVEMTKDLAKDDTESDETSTTRQYNGGPHFNGDIQISPLASFGYNFGIYAVNEEDTSVMPFYTRSTRDTVADAMSVGPFNMNIDMNSSLAVGKENLYMQAGINRAGFGPFLNDDLALSDNSFHAPSLSFTYDGGFWNYTQIMQSIGSSLNNGTKLNSEADVNKFFAFHSIRFDLTDKLSLSYYESTVLGKRFDMAYLLPAPFMAIQGIGDSTDNSQMGLMVEFSPVTGFKWSSNFFADDLELNEMVKLNIDTKIRIGIETGIQYSPLSSPIDLMTVNYTIITPYTYAHWSYNDDGKSFSDTSNNYFNYVNHGVQIGASIPPNSDRIGFSARFTPVKRLNITIRSNFMRHANAYESLSSSEAENIYLTNYYSYKNGKVYIDASTGQPSIDGSGIDDVNLIVLDTDGGDIYSTDGSAFTQQKLVGNDKHVKTAWNSLNLLNQDHAMTIIQTGFDLAYETPKMNFGTWKFGFGWTWEYITNNGVDQPIYTGRVGEGDYTKAYDNWVNNLHDSINNYLYFSVKVTY